MSKLHDEFVAEIGTSESIDGNMHSLMEAIAARIDACKGNRVKLSDLATVLREDPKAVSTAVQKVFVVPVDEPVVQPEVRKDEPVQDTRADLPEPVL